MADPFQDVDAAGAEFIRLFADLMDQRQSDPKMEKIVADYLARLTFEPSGLTIEVGAGAGAVTRRIAAFAHPTKVVGYEPSHGFVKEAQQRVTGLENLSFETADGAALPLEDESVDNVVMHTVLSHVVAPSALINEGFRVLKPGGKLVICDVDFSKAALGSFPNDPLDICVKAFVSEFVTDAHIVAKLGPLTSAAGFSVEHFDITSRVITSKEQMLPWVTEATRLMAERGEIGKDLAEALVGEHDRRLQAGQLYGYQAIATYIASK
ncbi:methyltransferase domain-containing protein [Halocynthiibacter sp. C4]|uniref:methyltransferase domain-containing protein n=1 Tax=Halocynthiibacter sp. C4 TaxID=2992758 RepID=UPI00237C33A4|nr:methyltransferase domain-containing protein [Halocynthiibacter sp. C4]MDE0590867.1 methyltransferase domain-containing protein [Halocynthiibacter sp. C4]